MGYNLVESGSRSNNSKNTLVLRILFITLVILVLFNLVFIYIPSKTSEKVDVNLDLIDYPIELSTNSYQSNQNDDIEQSSYSSREDSTLKSDESNKRIKPKKILIWNAYWGSFPLWHKIFFEIVYKQCPQSNCVMTVDKTELESSDAVLFHLVDVVKENYSFPKPPRNPDQIWIGMTYEPPYVLKLSQVNFSRLNGIFNRTMSYRRDSDVVAKHGTFVKIDENDNEQVLPNYMSDWIGCRKGTGEKNYAHGKSKMVNWFSSARGCKSQSNREKYVKELQKYVQVDVYGACGSLK
jgi:hypothetical protein